MLNIKRPGTGKLTLYLKRACLSNSNTKLCSGRWLEEEFSLQSRDLTRVKKESLLGMLVTRSILLTGMSSLLMGLRRGNISTVSSFFLARSLHPNRHNRSSCVKQNSKSHRSLWQPSMACAYGANRPLTTLQASPRMTVKDDMCLALLRPMSRLVVGDAVVGCYSFEYTN